MLQIKQKLVEKRFCSQNVTNKTKITQNTFAVKIKQKLPKTKRLAI